MLLFKTIIILLLSSLCTGCGFSPLYKNHAISHNNNNILNQVEIIIQKDNQLNQLVKKHLDSIFMTENNSKYILLISAEKKLSSALIQSNSTVSRYSMNLKVNYTIKDKYQNITLDHKATSLKGYYGYSSPYATYVAEEDEVKNLIREISNQIRNNVMIVLLRQIDENKSE